MSTIRELLHQIMDLKELGNPNLEYTEEFTQLMSTINKEQRLKLSKILSEISVAASHAAYIEERNCKHTRTEFVPYLDGQKEKCLDCVATRTKMPNPERKRMFDLHNPAFVFSSWNH